MNKELIKLRFQKNLNTYSQNAYIQLKMAKRLLSFLPEKEYKRILEIGCGSGLLTQLANEKLSFDKYIANDIVDNCEKFIKEINRSI